MLRHMPEQRDSGVSQHLKKKLSSKTTFRWRRRRPLLRRASGDCWSRVLWARGEARAGRRGEARRQVGRPHRIWADRPLQGLQVGTIIRRVYECFFSKIVSFFQILWIWKLSNVCSTPCLWVPPGIYFMVFIQGNCECHIMSTSGHAGGYDKLPPLPWKRSGSRSTWSCRPQTRLFCWAILLLSPCCGSW